METLTAYNAQGILKDEYEYDVTKNDNLTFDEEDTQLKSNRFVPETKQLENILFKSNNPGIRSGITNDEGGDLARIVVLAQGILQDLHHLMYFFFCEKTNTLFLVLSTPFLLCHGRKNDGFHQVRTSSICPTIHLPIRHVQTKFCFTAPPPIASLPAWSL